MKISEILLEDADTSRIKVHRTSSNSSVYSSDKIMLNPALPSELTMKITGLSEYDLYAVVKGGATSIEDAKRRSNLAYDKQSEYTDIVQRINTETKAIIDQLTESVTEYLKLVLIEHAGKMKREYDRIVSDE